MKVLGNQHIESFFHAQTSCYEVSIPVMMPNGERTLGKPGDGPVSLAGPPLPAKPTSFFLPQQELMFTVCDDKITVPPTDTKPLFITGFTPRDLLCLRFIDRFFSDGLKDDIYFRLRKNAVTAAVSGFCGIDGHLIPPSNGECDLEFVYDGNRWLVATYSDVGRGIALGICEEVKDDVLEEIRKEAALNNDEQLEILNRAAFLMQNTDIPDSFWSKIGDSCIQCTGCNLVCPTCTCFGLQDWRFPNHFERYRMWDSCQLEGFAKESGGHNPLGSEALRTRRRIHHKLSADPVRWGEISCFLCGRCDSICPTNIGMISVARAIVAEFG